MDSMWGKPSRDEHICFSDGSHNCFPFPSSDLDISACDTLENN